MVSALICSHGRAALPSIVCLPRRHMICLFDPMMNSDNNESEHNVMMCWWRLHVRVMGSCSSGGRSLIIGGEAAGPDPRLVSSRPHFKVSLSNMLHCSLLKKNNKKKRAYGRKMLCTQAATTRRTIHVTPGDGKLLPSDRKLRTWC